jgi:hypothetical protein
MLATAERYLTPSHDQAYSEFNIQIKRSDVTEEILVQTVKIQDVVV